MASVLTSVKKVLGITEEYEAFDSEIIIHINSVFAILTQLGVGPVEGFSIQDKTTEWEDYLTGLLLNTVKSYMGMKVKMLFDPPASASASTAMEKMIAEFEWRINFAADAGKHVDNGGEDFEE